jgi:polar amino acid transport system substrate-binding protein
MAGTGRAALVAAAFLLTAGAAGAETVVLRGDEWCPYTCAPGSERPGYAIEIAREVFGEAGLEVDYDTLTWGRSLRLAAAGSIDGVVGATADEVPGFRLTALPIGRARDGFVTRTGQGFRYDGTRSLDGLALGAIAGYDYGEALNAYIEAHGDDPTLVQVVHGDAAVDQNIEKLLAGRIDVFIEDVNVIAERVAVLGLEEALEVVPTAETFDLYIAFSPAGEQSARYVQLLDEGLVRLRSSGRLDRILSRYGLDDWE